MIKHDISKRGYFAAIDIEGFGSNFTEIVEVTGKIGSNWRGGPSPGDTIYYKNGKIHREDGPADIRPGWLVNYYLNNERMTFEQYWKKQKNTKYAPRIMAYALGELDKE